MRMHAMGDMYIPRDVKPHNVLLTWAQVCVRPPSRLLSPFALTLLHSSCLYPYSFM